MSLSEKALQLKADFDDVYETGKKAEQKAFWDNYHEGQYSYGGQGWTKDNFYPTRDIRVYPYGFYYHNWQGTAYDLAERLEECGVKMTLVSSAPTQGFRMAWLTRLPVLDFSNAAKGEWDRTFYSASGAPLVTIDKIILPPEGTITSTNSVFYGCSKLANITFEGVIDRSISFSACPLTVASMKNIISCLKDYTGSSEYSYTLTLKSSAFSALEAEGATAEYNGASCTWAELADNKKWNLTLA